MCMKKMLLMIFCITVCSNLFAQTYSEWMRQKKTQIKYLTQQIAALRVYGTYLKQGYNIVQDGLQVVDDIRDGDFSLHNNYFTSLKAVNPAISDNSKTQSIADLQLQILTVNQAITKAVKDDNIHSDERAYIEKVIQSFLDKCSDKMDELTQLTTDGNIELKDDERIKIIDAIYADMQDKYAFVSHLKNEVQVLALSRSREANNVQSIQSLYGTSH